jgi:integrase
MGKPVKHRNKWRIRWFDENGQRRSESYDDHRDALYKLRQHEAAVEEIRRGLRSPDPPKKTFGELCDYWLTNRASRKRDPKDDESIVRCHLRPTFGEMLARAVTVENIDKFVVSRAHLDPKTVANILTLLGSMFRVALDLGWVMKLPAIKKPRVPLFTTDFRYLRTDEELRRFLRAAQDEGENVLAMYATAAYTGMRAGELAGLQWDDVDLDKRLITVQRSFNGPTKSGDVRYVPILDPLLPILRAWRLKCPGRLAFPNEAGNMHHPSASIFQEVLHRVLDVAGFQRNEHGGKVRWYIRFHDLRHTFASHWVMNGGDLFKLQKILGHKTVQMTMRYAHLQPSAFKDDWGRMGEKLSLAGAAVVQLPVGK